MAVKFASTDVFFLVFESESGVDAGSTVVVRSAAETQARVVMDSQSHSCLSIERVSCQLLHPSSDLTSMQIAFGVESMVSSRGSLRLPRRRSLVNCEGPLPFNGPIGFLEGQIAPTGMAPFLGLAAHRGQMTTRSQDGHRFCLCSDALWLSLRSYSSKQPGICSRIILMLRPRKRRV